MKTLLLTIWLASGDRLIEPVTATECSEIIATAQALRVLDMQAETENGIRVVRIGCGDADIVLALPTSDMPCEWEGA